jgi:hypothetical protein
MLLGKSFESVLKETSMRRYQWTHALWLIVAIAWIASTGAADVAAIGTWSGKWEGGGSGGTFVITLADAKSGKVDVGTDGGPYTATFMAVTLDGGKFSATYAYPLDAQGEITLTGVFEGANGKGTWDLHAKGSGGSMANGTWTVEKK